MSGAHAIFGSDAVECGMLFIHPTWDNEGQRIGKRKCTPAGEQGVRLRVIILRAIY